MADARVQLEQLLTKHALPGWRIDCFDLGGQRMLAFAEWHAAGEEMIQRVSVQGPRSREQAYEELLAAAVLRVRAPA